MTPPIPVGAVPPDPPLPGDPTLPPLPAAPAGVLPPLPPMPVVGALVPAVQAATTQAAANIEHNGRICNSTASLLRP